jgi:hypothetical protein
MNPMLTPKQLITNQIKIVILSIFIGFLTSALLAFPIKWLWNWIMPGLAGLGGLSAIQAWGMMFLFRLMFPITKIEQKGPETKVK